MQIQYTKYFWWIHLIVSSGISFVYCQGYKRWKTSTNFEEAGNWNTGRVPCSSDRVVFPSSAPPVFLQTNTSIAELVLPRNGEIVLGDYVSLSFPAETVHDNTCIGEDVTYSHTEPDSWFNVTNWCSISDIDGDCSVVQPLVLDSEKIPCQYDSAVFPRGQSFLVGLGSGVDIYLKSLILNSKRYSTGSFRQLLDSEEGKKQFFRSPTGSPTTINIRNDESCADVTGCACGNDESAILDKICENIDCQDTNCQGSFTPMGGCCPVCGALLELDYTYSKFKITSLKNIIERNYLRNSADRPKYEGVKYIISKTSLDHIQIVLLDGENGETAARLGRVFTNYIKKDISSTQRFGISHIKLQTSTSFKANSEALKSEQKSLGGGAIIGIVIGLSIFLLIILVVVFYVVAKRSNKSVDYKLKLPSVKSFKKFNRFSMSSENREDLSPSVGFQDTVIMSDLVRGFDNPMYAAPGATIEEKADERPYIIDSPDVQMTNNNSNGFTNPLYGDGPVQELVHSDLGMTSMLKFNPVFTTEGIENDSEI